MEESEEATEEEVVKHKTILVPYSDSLVTAITQMLDLSIQ